MEIKMAQNKKEQNSVNNAEMNLDRAREIVASDERGSDYEAALQYLRMYDKMTITAIILYCEV